MIPMYIPNETEIANAVFSQNSDHCELQTDGPVKTMEINVRKGIKMCKFMSRQSKAMVSP